MLEAWLRDEIILSVTFSCSLKYVDRPHMPRHRRYFPTFMSDQVRVVNLLNYLFYLIHFHLDVPNILHLDSRKILVSQKIEIQRCVRKKCFTRNCHLKNMLSDYLVFSETVIICILNSNLYLEILTILRHNDKQRNHFISAKYCRP